MSSLGKFDIVVANFTNNVDQNLQLPTFHLGKEIVLGQVSSVQPPFRFSAAGLTRHTSSKRVVINRVASPSA
jgi:hypothetical protein